MADIKPPEKGKRWKIASGDKVGIVDPFGGIYEVTNKHLEDPAVIAFIKQIQQKTGHTILGTLIVEA